MASKKYKGTVMDLIKSIKKETEMIQVIYENVSESEHDSELIYEAADKYIGAAIGALNAGKNFTETMPGSAEVLAGLILMTSKTNVEAMNINDKKFGLVRDFTSDKENVKKYVANLGKTHGPSIAANIRAHVADPDRRDAIKRKLVTAQTAWSQAKQKARKGREFDKVANVANL